MPLRTSARGRLEVKKFIFDRLFLFAVVSPGAASRNGDTVDVIS